MVLMRCNFLFRYRSASQVGMDAATRVVFEQQKFSFLLPLGVEHFWTIVHNLGRLELRNAFKSGLHGSFPFAVHNEFESHLFARTLTI